MFRRGKRMKRSHKRVLIAGLAAVLLFSGCGLIPEEPELETAAVIERCEHEEYKTADCTRRDLEDVANIYAKYVPVRTENLCFAAADVNYGDTYVSVGETVKKGELLAQLKMGSLEEDLAALLREIDKLTRSKAQTEENMELKLRMQMLENTTLSEEAGAKALEEIEKSYGETLQALDDAIYLAEIRREECEKAIEARRIYAPFDGVVTYIYKHVPTDLSEPSKTVMILVDSSLSIFSAETEYSAYFSEGDLCTITVRNKEYHCEVRSAKTLGITENPEKPKVYLVLTEPAFDIEDDSTGRFSIVLNARENALTVPIHAVSKINGETVVYYPGEDGMKYYREVETGIDDGHFIEIISGLDEGDVVIVN